jgi:hypothetical protein
MQLQVSMNSEWASIRRWVYEFGDELISTLIPTNFQGALAFQVCLLAVICNEVPFNVPLARLPLGGPFQPRDPSLTREIGALTYVSLIPTCPTPLSLQRLGLIMHSSLSTWDYLICLESF